MGRIAEVDREVHHLQRRTEKIARKRPKSLNLVRPDPMLTERQKFYGYTKLENQVIQRRRVQTSMTFVSVVTMAVCSRPTALQLCHSPGSTAENTGSTKLIFMPSRSTMIPIVSSARSLRSVSVSSARSRRTRPNAS